MKLDYRKGQVARSKAFCKVVMQRLKALSIYKNTVSGFYPDSDGDDDRIGLTTDQSSWASKTFDFQLISALYVRMQRYLAPLLTGSELQ